MQSCLYEGRVRHVRSEPLVHRFDYRLAMAFLDLDEVQNATDATRLIPNGRFSSVSFRPEDHASGLVPRGAIGSARQLADRIRDLVEREAGCRPAGPVRLLTQLRYVGHYFSPLNLYYCHRQDGRTDAVVAEVSNTPWGERHHYVLHEGNQVPAQRALRYRHRKEFHVSPFMDMDATYDWQLNVPGSRLRACITSTKDGAPFFFAAMMLRRKKLSPGSLRSLLIKYPLMTVRIATAIYWQAFQLWKKKCPFYPHPRNLPREVHRVGS